MPANLRERKPISPITEVLLAVFEKEMMAMLEKIEARKKAEEKPKAATPIAK